MPLRTKEYGPSEDRLSAVLESALDCIICMDQHGLVQEWNGAAERTFGFTREQALGRELAELIVPVELREAHRRGRARYLESGEAVVLGKRIEVPALRADGSRILVELAITAIHSGAGPFFTAYLRDITVQRRGEQRRAAQYAVARLLTGARGIAEIGSEILAQLATIARWQFGAIWLCETNASPLRAVAIWSETENAFPEFAQMSRELEMPAGTGLPGRVLEAGEPAWVHDVAAESNFPRAAAAAREGLRGAFAFPLAGGGHTLGAIEMFSVEKQDFDEDLLSFAAALGSNIGQFLERQRAEAEVLEQKLMAEEQRGLAEEQRKAAEAANAAKDRFIAALSHELRTPLTPVLFWTCSNVENENLPSEFREDLRMVRRNVELEARLIDELIDFTRLTRGRTRLNTTVQPAHEQLREALRAVQPDIERKQLALELDLTAQNSAIAADSPRLQQVFWHLLQNACKFTRTGGRVLVRSRADAGEFRVEICDTGTGIEPALMPKIFDPFEQASKERFGGIGLGLAISKMLVELHGGSIAAASAGAEQGATFTVRLPLAVAVNRAAAPVARLEMAASPQPALRILYVEDHEPTSAMLSRILRRTGYEVTTAASVQTATAALAEHEFDLIISDIGLPDGTGWDVIRKAREQRGVPGIAISGYGAEEDVRRSLEAGFSAHFVKPVDLGRLKQAIVEYARPAAA